MKISRQAYSELYGPTVGDSVRLGDTNLWVTPESDYASPGEEVTFGGGKVIRDGMGQSQARDLECMDLVITNALILDYSAIVKADVGVKHGRIAGYWEGGKSRYTGWCDCGDRACNRDSSR